MKRFISLITALSLMALTAACSNVAESAPETSETSASVVSSGSAEESGGTTDPAVKPDPAPSVESFTNDLIDPVIAVHFGEMGYDLKIKNATVEVFRFISETKFFRCDYDEVYANLKEALNTLNADDLESFRINMGFIADTIDELKIGRDDVLNSFDDVDAKDTVSEYMSDPTVLESWTALQTVLNQLTGKH